MTSRSDMARPHTPEQLGRSGFIQRDNLIDASFGKELAATLAGNASVSGARQVGARHLIDSPLVRSLLRVDTLRHAIQRVTSPQAFAFKATLFDKHLDANWLVTWHQDTLIPVARRVDSTAWSRWSIKNGVPYAHPPLHVLQRIVALRIHLDDCNMGNGPLRVREGSHLLGVIPSNELADRSTCHREHIVTGAAGSAVFMRPLLVHASSKAVTRARRRVLHLEFADFDLPDGADWVRRVSL
jgi:hypothetical protein